MVDLNQVHAGEIEQRQKGKRDERQDYGDGQAQ